MLEINFFSFRVGGCVVCVKRDELRDDYRRQPTATEEFRVYVSS